MERTALLLDVGYVMQAGRSRIRLLVKDPESGSTTRVYDDGFGPYFYVKPKPDILLQDAMDGLRQIKSRQRGREISVKAVGKEKRVLLGKEAELARVVCFHPSDVTALREEAKKFGEAYEHEISFTKRYVIDKQIVPNDLIDFEIAEGENGKIATNVRKSGKSIPAEKMGVRLCGLDIETYNPQGVPSADKDPVLMVGVADSGGERLFTHTKKVADGGVECLETEKEMLEEVGRYLKREKADLLCTYNGDVFDLPYMRDRAKKTGARMFLGRDRSEPKSKQLGIRMTTSLNGRIHFDAFPVVSLMNFIGAFKLDQLTLRVAYREILGGKKEDVEKEEIWKLWDDGGEAGLKRLYKYCKVDALAALQLSERLLPLEIELSKITGGTLFDTSRATPGQLVEMILMREAFRSGEIILSKPKFSEVQARQENPVEGAFVKLPSPGVYENLAVLDFRSLYPSIIISHNIDPSTLNCDDCTETEAFVSPKGHRFCRKRKGLIPRVLENVLKSRIKIKEEMKNLKKSGEEDAQKYKELDAKQWSLKILANSAYGYLLYARSRYYSRPCGESVTAYARDYIRETMEKAEKAGLKVLYGDTDSIFLQYENGAEQKVFEFQKKINAELPESMELELEDIYPRGIFVGKKQETEKGAKKKYALINREGKIKIRGFELVRRDWSGVAKTTQKEVLRILLVEGNVEKAVEKVRAVVKELKSGKTPLADLVISTQLKKKAKSYEIVSPEVSAMLKAQKAGRKIDEHSLIQYVVTTNGKTISEKATIADMAEDYDADYYVNNQVLPAVLKILGALGYGEDDIKLNGRQKSLGDW